MIVALLSDIHANASALRVVVNELQNRNIETVIVAGDSLGYYYDFKEVRSLLAKFNVFETLGNHEIQLLGDDLSSWEIYEQKYGSGLRMAKSGLGVDELEKIRNFLHPLPLELQERRILISHGSPWDINEYLYPNVDLKVWDRFDAYDFDVFVVGHTHHQMIKRIGNKVVVNPGSVGQNRSTRAAADWALLSLSDLSVTFHSTPYDSRPLLDQCQELDPGLQLLSRHLI